MAISNYWMSQMNLYISPGQVIWPRAVLVVGLGDRFAPANVAAYLYTPAAVAWRGCGLIEPSAQRGRQRWNVHGSDLQERRDQFHALRLGESLDPLNPAVQSFLEQAQARFLQQTGDPAAAQQLAWQALENLRHQQASALAYFDCLLAIRRRDACAGARCFPDETFGGRERCARRHRVKHVNKSMTQMGDHRSGEQACFEGTAPAIAILGYDNVPIYSMANT